MSVPVLTAVTGAPWEAALVAHLERAPAGITVIRRCVDLADLLAVAATGQARAVLLSADLRRLDGDALTRLVAARVAAVGLFTPGDAESASRLRALGLRQVLPADAPPADIATAVAAALAVIDSGTHETAYADPAAALPDLPDPPAAPDGPADPAQEPGAGRLVAVWGPTGAPGRTTVAIGVASELAHSGVGTLLADADVYGAVVGQVLGFLDEAPGLAAAVRLANLGQLDATSLARLAPTAAPNLRVLTGISRVGRWPELHAAALEQVWALARGLARFTVVDCGFSLESDEELSYDTAAPRRNAATLTTLECADTVVAVGSADPVGVQRLLRGLSDLRETIPHSQPTVVLNRVRRSAVGSHPERQLTEAVQRYAGIREVVLVPDDQAALDAAVLAGRPLCEMAADTAVRQALAALAAGLSGRAPAAGGGRWQRRRRARVAASRRGSRRADA